MRKRKRKGNNGGEGRGGTGGAAKGHGQYEGNKEKLMKGTR